MSKFYGQSEENIRDIFRQAEEDAPSIIFIDEIDSIAPNRDNVQGEVERRVVAQLLAVMDGLKSRGKVVVIGATNRPNSIEPALRRPGRFDREIEISMPDVNSRKEILGIHTREMPLDDSVDIDSLSKMTHGYAGADLAALSREAAMNSIRRSLPDIDMEEDVISSELLRSLMVTMDDFMEAFKGLQPSTLREVLIEKPNIFWEDIGGLEDVKESLKEMVEWPIKYYDIFKEMNAEAPAGILLVGPPGTGKTLAAKAVATECEANFISVKGPEFLSKWVGESEKAVREVFRKARLASPCIIFFDEIDAIAPLRGSGSDSNVTERVVSQLLTEIDGLKKLHKVMLIAATNRLDILDPALIRPGRFDRIIEINHPDKTAREEIVNVHLKNKNIDETVSASKIAGLTEEFSGADLALVIKEAVMLAIRCHIQSGMKDKCKVTWNDIEEAIHKIRKQKEVMNGKAASTIYQ